MSRLLFLLAVAIVVYLLLRSFQRQGAQQSDRPAGGDRAQDSEEMVRCEQCGVHLPRSEGFMAGGKFFCSDEHRRQYGAK